MRKRDRLRLIETLIKEKRLSTQRQLVGALRRHGFDVTQATISRDLRDLGVRKGAGPDGQVQYLLPPPQAGTDPTQVLARVLRDSGATIRQAQNLVVVRSEPGTAPNVGRSIDELDRDDVVGTVAGDDTVVMVLADNGVAEEMAQYLNDLGKG
jgi:transcriptional regulator of arginine metabolism